LKEIKKTNPVRKKFIQSKPPIVLSSDYPKIEIKRRGGCCLKNKVK